MSLLQDYMSGDIGYPEYIRRHYGMEGEVLCACGDPDCFATMPALEERDAS